jgi:hypothetical protein
MGRGGRRSFGCGKREITQLAFGGQSWRIIMIFQRSAVQKVEQGEHYNESGGQILTGLKGRVKLCMWYCIETLDFPRLGLSSFSTTH